MKYVSILWRFFKGIRLDALLLIVMMTWAMLAGMLLPAKVENIFSDVNVLESGVTENTYVLMDFDSAPLEISKNAAKLEAALEKEDVIAHVFSIRVANPISYQDSQNSIVLYEPEMLEFFPQLKKEGLNFDKYPDGCILASGVFSGFRRGDSLRLKFGYPANAKYDSLTVADHLGAPYRYMSFNTAATNPLAGDLFAEGDVLLMQGTPSVLEKLDSLGVKLTHNPTLIAVFREGTTKEQQEQLLQELAPNHLRYSMQQLIDSSKKMLADTLKEELPQPLFLAISSLLAYLSIVVLIIKKKEKELAVLHLCGASRRKCALITFLTCQCVALVPLLLNLILTQILPDVSWALEEYVNGLPPIEILKGGQEQFQEWVNARNHDIVRQGLYDMLRGCKFGLSSMMVLFGYYLTTVLIALGATAVSMAKHTPLTYLRGASE